MLSAGVIVSDARNNSLHSKCREFKEEEEEEAGLQKQKAQCQELGLDGIVMTVLLEGRPFC